MRRVRIYGMLLAAYGKAGRLRSSLAVLKQMRQEAVRPNGYVYAGLIEACVVLLACGCVGVCLCVL